MRKFYESVEYDETHKRIYENVTDSFRQLDQMAEKLRIHGSIRSVTMFKTKLEEAHMWFGKVVRDHQNNAAKEG